MLGIVKHLYVSTCESTVYDCKAYTDNAGKDKGTVGENHVESHAWQGLQLFPLDVVGSRK